MDDRKELIQKIKSYKGLLLKQNKVINKMAETILEDSHKLGTYWCNGCAKVSECKYKEHKDCVREHFEKISK